jgi:hypothetical protein
MKAGSHGAVEQPVAADGPLRDPPLNRGVGRPKVQGSHGTEVTGRIGVIQDRPETR